MIQDERGDIDYDEAGSGPIVLLCPDLLARVQLGVA
jgi:hypothetical protein